MQVQVLFFGMLKELTGRASESLSLPEGARLADVMRHYEQHIPRWKDLSASIAMSINQEYAGSEAGLKSGDEIGLLPPVSGGSSPATAARRTAHCAIVNEPIDSEALLAEIKRPEDGAAVTFDGVVRNNTKGRSTLFLDYEAYEEMALKQMEQLAERALADFQVRDVRIVHRLGRLQIGETSVLIVVASAHRGAAFDACRWLIDTLKRTVPIWKKEHFEDGAVWADGEPFPPEVPKAGSSRGNDGASK
jgi:molybdopterin synthase catalytic subunit